MKILCTICIRAGSRSVKNKNIKLINKKPLVYYTITQAKKSDVFEDIVVSTDSKKFQKITTKYGIKNFFLRPKWLSTSRSPKIPVIRHALKEAEKFYNKKYDFIIDLDATSPLRLVKDIKLALKQCIKNKSNLLFSVNESRINPYFNSVEVKKNRIIQPVKQLGFILKRRQDAPKVYDLNASIYIWKRKTLLSTDSLFVKKNSMYIMPNNRGYEIDTMQDFEIVSHLMNNELYKKI
jgi:CMP-N,N'-diacetyllegionaminic acid synthase